MVMTARTARSGYCQEWRQSNLFRPRSSMVEAFHIRLGPPFCPNITLYALDWSILSQVRCFLIGVGSNSADYDRIAWLLPKIEDNNRLLHDVNSPVVPIIFPIQASHFGY
jgi:hypothetical protein